MSATAASTAPGFVSRATRARARLQVHRLPLLAFAGSRIAVLALGVLGSVLGSRQDGWTGFDPHRLTLGFGQVGNVLAAPSVRWDSLHYLAIAQHGYKAAADTAFFPLYPFLIHVGRLITGSAALAGILISLGSFAGALVLLHRLTELELGRAAADATALLLAFAPLTVFFGAVYTESLFLLLAIGAVYAARRERWTLAAVVAALAAVTRVPGILVAIPVALLYLRSERRPGRGLAPLLLAPAAVGGFLLYLHARGFGLLAPLHQQQGSQHAHHLTNPAHAILTAIQAGASGLGGLVSGVSPIYSPTVGGSLSPDAERVLLLLVLAAAIAALVGAFRRLPLAYGALSAAILIVCVDSPSSGQPLLGLDRYALTIFPLWMVAGAWIARRRIVSPVVLLSAVLAGFYAFQFSTWAFIG